MFRRGKEKWKEDVAGRIHRNMDKYRLGPYTELEIVTKAVKDLDGDFMYIPPRNKPCFWMRLTIPVYVIVYILMFAFMPFKFMFTGDFYYDSYHGFASIVYSWHRQLFGWNNKKERDYLIGSPSLFFRPRRRILKRLKAFSY